MGDGIDEEEDEEDEEDEEGEELEMGAVGFRVGAFSIYELVCIYIDRENNTP